MNRKDFIEKYGSGCWKDVPFIYEDGSSLISSSFKKEGFTQSVGINLSVNLFAGFGYSILHEVKDLKPYLIRVKSQRDKSEFFTLVLAGNIDSAIRFIVNKFHSLDEIQVMDINTYMICADDEDIKFFRDIKIDKE
jgi:hypothetical protein